MTPLTKLHASGAGFLAAEHLHSTATAKISAVALYSHINFGTTPKNRRAALDRAISTGWLSRATDGYIQLGAPAIAFFNPRDAEVEVPEPTGSLATSRTSSAYDRPPLSRRFMPSSRGFRDDVQAFSVRPAVSFRTLAGGRP